MYTVSRQAVVCAAFGEYATGRDLRVARTLYVQDSNGERSGLDPVNGSDGVTHGQLEINSSIQIQTSPHQQKACHHYNFKT